MAGSKPLWRRGVEAVDKAAAPVLEGATRHEAFGLGVGLVHQTRKAVQQRAERVSRQLLHGLNLPTASDVNRLLAQIAAVENRVRQLDTRVEGQLLASGNDPRAGSSRAGEPDEPRASCSMREDETS
jgi:hypothetical protein